MVEVWWSLLGAAIPAIIAGQAYRIRRNHAEEQRIKSARGREKSTDDIFVCERVCTSKRMLKKHQVPNWNDVCLRRCQSECLKLSSSPPS
ncbi:hypothetical protein K7X08_002967 [Anisodus acutangulus]|uniref:Uncharacterized protein n=1 Tax=Anisodus acutangulus TaxID=402998 RepID=A0A9Q1MHW1_9SOLA|nr:hypothetical protein K7X08_002967 [Anisodus acutangulus]